MPGNGWAASDIALLVTAVTQLLVAIAGLWAIFRTKAVVHSVDRMVDGRFSQLIDLVGRVSGAPERRALPPDRKPGDL